MNADELRDALRDSGFLRDASEKDLARVAAIANSREFGEGDLILREGDTATDMLIVLSGSVSIEICSAGVGCRRIMTLVHGDLLSWSSVLEQTRLIATARAIGPTVLAAIDGRQLLTLCEHDPAFGYALMRRVALAIAHRLTAARMQLLDVFGTQMPQVPQPAAKQA